MLFGLVYVAIFPGSVLISWIFPLVAVVLPMSFEMAMVTTLIGICCGFFVGWILDHLQAETRNLQSEEKSGKPMRISYGMSMFGLFAGWQSVLVVAVMYVLARAILVRFERSDKKSYFYNMFWSPNAALLIVVLLHLLSWRWLSAVV